MIRWKETLSAHAWWLEWVHAVASIVLVIGPGLVCFWSHPLARISLLWKLFGVGALTLVGACQMIGIVHAWTHRRPAGPRWIGTVIAELGAALVGLHFEKHKTLHLMHHKHLGDPLDPDAATYRVRRSLFKRGIRLFALAPLRQLRLSHEIRASMNRWSSERKQEYRVRLKRANRLLVGVHLVLFVTTGTYYLPLFLAVLLAHVFSNVREMTEHSGREGVALVNIFPDVLGGMFFSTPGFWFHGTHHLDPTVHYLELPDRMTRIENTTDFALIKRRNYLKFFFTG